MGCGGLTQGVSEGNNINTWARDFGDIFVEHRERKTPERDLGKSNGVFINVQWDCPKRTSGKQPLQLVPVFKGKARNCEVCRKAAADICSKQVSFTEQRDSN